MRRGEREHLNQAHRVFGKKIILGQREPTPVQHKALQRLGGAAQTGNARQSEAPPLGRMGIIQMRQEHTGQIPHDLRVEEVMLHEPFDRRPSWAVIVAHPRCNLALDVKGEAFFGALGDKMQMAAHGP